MSETALEAALAARRQADCVADAARVDAAFHTLATDIGARLAQRNPLLLCVMNGGLAVAGRLLPLLDFPLEVDYVHASRYGQALGGGTLLWRVHPPATVAGRTVLVVDDILDEGHTLLAIAAELRARGAAEILSAVLVHKVHARKAMPGLRADFSGLDLPDRFLFGCGMDYRGYWRNTDAIYALPEAAQK